MRRPNLALAFLFATSCTSAERVVVHHAVDAACHAVVLSGSTGRAEEICATILEWSEVLDLLLAARDAKKPATFEVTAGSSRRQITVTTENIDRVIESLVSVGATPRKKAK